MLNIHSRKHKNCSTKVCQNKTNPKRQNESHRPLSKTGLWPCWECLVSQQPVARNGLLAKQAPRFLTLTSSPSKAILGTQRKGLWWQSSPKPKCITNCWLAEPHNNSRWFRGFSSVSLGWAFLCSYLKTDFQEDSWLDNIYHDLSWIQLLQAMQAAWIPSKKAQERTGIFPFFSDQKKNPRPWP